MTAALVLVADDDPFNYRLLSEVCQASGYRVVGAGDGREVLGVVARERPDLILLDISMPDVDGYEVLKVLKADAELASIPVICVTGEDDVDSKEKAIALGAEDYVTKPFRVFEIQQRIKNALRTSRAEGEVARARTDASVDPLTHTGTSQQLFITLDYELSRAARYGHALTCMIVRIANGRQIADQLGADVADAAMVQLASGLRQCIRAIDHLFRSDVHEFAVVLPETPADGAEVVRSRITGQASSRTLFGPAMGVEPALAIGVSAVPADTAANASALIQLAVERSRA